jgi:two-component sensor histidine kinase/integral membrane sensor domain MASE1
VSSSGETFGSKGLVWLWSSPAGHPYRAPLLVPIFGLVYFLAAKVGVATSLPPEGIVIIWPPNAIVLVTLLMVHRGHWWAFFLATVITEVAADLPDYPLWAAAGYGIVNFAEGALTATLLSRLNRKVPAALAAQGFIRFLAIGPLLASGVAALFGAAIYKIGAPELSYLHYWRVFWFGDALGLLLVGTALFTFSSVPRWWRNARSVRAAEAAALLFGLFSANAWAFFGGSDIPRVYAVFPFLLWAAVRFGAHGASVAVLATIGLAIASAADGVGPFASLSSVDVVIALQSLSLVVAVSTFFLAFTIEDFWHADAQLRAEIDQHRRTTTKLKLSNEQLEVSNAHLDQVVAERTCNLQNSLARNQVLLKEVHHRVKNSLQMISALVSIQGRSGTGLELSHKINKQVSAIAATYDVIHRMESVETADLGMVVSELCADISESMGGLASVVAATEGQVLVTADAAVALALALNELITNSIKHAGAETGKVCIQVNCHQEDGRAIVRIEDNGPGYPRELDIAKCRGFGLRMTERMVSRAGGSLELGLPGAASTAEIRLPIASPPLVGSADL